MSRLGNAIQKVNAASGLTSGRTKIKTDDLIAGYPNGVHITAISKNNYNGSSYYAYTFIEDPTKFFTGGTVVTEKTDQLLDDYDGDLAELNADLQKEYLKAILSKKRGKNNREYTNVAFLGTVPASKFNTYTDENGNTIDAETGEVIVVDGVEIEKDGQQRLFSNDSKEEVPF